MGKKMMRGKQQVLFNYLPGRTFDFEKVSTIARVTAIRGNVPSDINPSLLLRKVADDARAWDQTPIFRPVLRDDVLRDPSRFVLLEPTAVQAEMFPRVLWCQSRKCGRVINTEQFDTIPKICPSCRSGALIQLRFVRIHRCGDISPVVPPVCPTCKNSRSVALDTRGGERFSSFLWTCQKCKSSLTYNAGYCRACSWPGEAEGKKLQVEVHRAGRTFYPHTAVLLNVPNRQFDNLFSKPDWQGFVAAKFLEFAETKGQSLENFARAAAPQSAASNDVVLSKADFDDLLAKQSSGQLSPEEFVEAMKKLRAGPSTKSSESDFAKLVSSRTSVPWPVWERAGYELMEAILPSETNGSKPIISQSSSAAESAKDMGFEAVTLESDFPIITATYGFSRAEYRPGECRLNAFPPDSERAGKIPIFVDKVQADAIIVRLSPTRVLEWLLANDVSVTVPAMEPSSMAAKAFFIQLFDEVSFGETIGKDNPATRLTFGLLHTLSHIAVRRAALLCGLDQTSLSEYLLPRSLAFAIYCNHRFGATIGALTALFEQAANEWLSSIKKSQKCVYDPVCKNSTGNCHACVHLAETSCRYFNLNLNRAFLFGGKDEELGNIKRGFLDAIPDGA